MTTETVPDHPCLPGGLIPLDQWTSPGTSVQKTLRSAFRDIVKQLRAGLSPEEQAFKRLDDLPALSIRELERFAPEPGTKELAVAVLRHLEALQQASTHNRQLRFLVITPFSGIPEALRATHRRVISPPDNLLMSGQDAANWWDEQLQDDDWVIPELANFWLRHRSGLSLLKEFFARVALDDAGKGIVGCSSWCWAFWIQYLPELHVGPITLSPLTGERLTRWLDYLAAGEGGQAVAARMTHDGRPVLPPPVDDSDREYSSFSQDLANLARGNRGVSLAIWQRALRARPEEDSEAEDQEGQPANGPRCWVAPLEQLSLPAVPQSSGEQPGHILHALLLHDGLTREQLEIVVGISGQEVSLTLARFIRADLIIQDAQTKVFWLTPLGYPAVRKYLQARGYPVDGF